MYICDCSPTAADVGVATVICDSSRNGLNNRRNHICDPFQLLQRRHFNIILMGLRPFTTVANVYFSLKKNKKMNGAIFVDNLNKYINKYLKYINI